MKWRLINLRPASYDPVACHSRDVNWVQKKQADSNSLMTDSHAAGKLIPDKFIL